MRYKGVIYKLIAGRNCGFIKYVEDGIEKDIFFRAFAKIRNDIENRNYWMDGDEVEFSIEELEGKLVASELVYLCNKRVECLCASGVNKGTILEGSIQEFNNKLFFIDEKFGVLFLYHYKQGQLSSKKREHTQVKICCLKKLMVKPANLELRDDVQALADAALQKNEFKALVTEITDSTAYIYLEEFDIDASLRLKAGFKIVKGDEICVKLINPKNLTFRLV